MLLAVITQSRLGAEDLRTLASCRMARNVKKREIDGSLPAVAVCYPAARYSSCR